MEYTKASRGRETPIIRALFSNSLSRHGIWGLFGSQNSSCDLVGFYTTQSCKWKYWCSPARLRSMKMKKTTVSAVNPYTYTCKVWVYFWSVLTENIAELCSLSVLFNYVHTMVPWPMMSLSSHFILYLPFVISNCAIIGKEKVHTHTHTCEKYNGSYGTFLFFKRNEMCVQVLVRYMQREWICCGD